MRNTVGVLYEAGTAYLSLHLSSPPILFDGVRVAHCFSFLCCPIVCLYFLSLDVWYVVLLCVFTF